MSALACFLVSLALLAWSFALRPHRYRAPSGWYVNGVSPAGAFELRRVLGNPARDLDDAHARRDWSAEDHPIAGQIYCTGGATPRHDGESVWCQR